MARIKGKWVGQVVVELNEETDSKYVVEANERFFKKSMIGLITQGVNVVLQPHLCDTLSVTVTQLHAELYRDEPSEWTREEATP